MIIITTIIVTALGVVFGITLERNRWVRAVKDNKVIAVDGNLYKVTKTGDNAG